MLQKNWRVAIIGGGMTGLVLAYFLGKAGCRITIIEKASTLSGLLAFTYIETVPIERYYHHFFTNDRYMLELLDELGLGDQIMWQESKSAVYHHNTMYPFVTKGDFLRLPFLSWGAKVKGAAAAVQFRMQSAEKILPTLTAEIFLKKKFGREGYEKMWRPLLVNKFGDNANKIPAQWIAKRIQARSRSERHGREVLGYIKGSYRVLVERLHKVILEQGGNVELNAEVTSLPRNTAGRYQINNQEYDLVVSTVAPDLIKKIVPELEIPAVTYRAAICPIFVLKKNFTPYYWINNLDMNVPFSVIVNEQALLPLNYYGGLWPMYVGHYVPEDSSLLKKTDEELKEYYLGYLRELFPGIDHGIVSYQIGRTKYAQPVMTTPWTPLQHKTNVPNLYLTSMAHIYPEDRGVNYSIREANRITELLNNDLRNK